VTTTVVTGGGTGIGFAIAERLAAEGHRIVLAARTRSRLEAARERLAAAGADCEVATLDVRDAAAVDDLFARLPEVDNVVNNAAGNFACDTLDLSPNGFRAVVEISLLGCFNCSRALARRLVDEGRPGAILNIVATYAETGAPRVAHSAAAKAGMVAFTKSVAREWGPHGIRVNALAPGFVATEAAIGQILDSPEAQERMREQIALGRFGEASEIAAAAAFALSESAAYMTGAVLAVDGGRSLGIAMHERTAEAVA
jgi:NAD(P)-dependent dehydrogenase (short-subunit alcohol dehydrogenase family)